MSRSAFWQGAVAGLAGTVIMTTAYKLAERKILAPPQSDTPPQRMAADLTEATPAPVATRKAETPLATALHFGYGAAFGAAFGLAQSRLRQPFELSGAVLGVGMWAFGYFGWVPAAGLYPRFEQQRGRYFWAPLALNVVYGLGTAYAFHELYEQSWLTRVKRQMMWSIGKTVVKTAIARAL